MSEIPTEQTPTDLPTPETTTESSISAVDNLKNTVGNVLGSWKLKVGLAVAVLFGVFLFTFYWQHIIAVVGMKSLSLEILATLTYSELHRNFIFF